MNWEGESLAAAAAPSFEDRIEIDRLYAKYAWAVDTADRDAFMRCFAGEFVIDDPSGVYEGEDGLNRFLSGLVEHNADFKGRQHWASQMQIRGDGDRAHARTYLLVTSLMPTGATKVHLIGTYEDELIKVREGWRFEKRIIRPWEGELLSRFPSYGPTA